MKKDDKIYVAGHNGMVGSALLCELQRQGFSNVLTKSRSDLDLTRQAEVMDFFSQEKPTYVFFGRS
jgi:GDP-L-fucose synthase